MQVVHGFLEQLGEERTGQIIVYKEPFIYMISGYVRETNVRSCQKFHLGEKIWTDFSSIPFKDSLVGASSVTMHDFIYLFDSFNSSQTIYKV